MDPISSTQNAKVKLVKSLQTRPRARRAERKIVLEGVRLVKDAILQGFKPLFVFYESQTADYEVVALVQDRKIELLSITADVMNHLSETQNPQGIIGVFNLPMPSLPKKAERILILDGLSDPGNLGTMLRTAAASGVQVVLLTPGSADPYNPKTLRSGMGAHFRIPIMEADWGEIKGYCDGLNVYAAAGDGDLEYDQAEWLHAWALVIGSEAHGISPEARNMAKHSVFIPMSANTESLNAAMAAAVILFEANRQQRRKKD